jgi:hypothetical protein
MSTKITNLTLFNLLSMDNRIYDMILAHYPDFIKQHSTEFSCFIIDFLESMKSIFMGIYDYSWVLKSDEYLKNWRHEIYKVCELLNKWYEIGLIKHDYLQQKKSQIIISNRNITAEEVTNVLKALSNAMDLDNEIYLDGIHYYQYSDIKHYDPIDIHNIEEFRMLFKNRIIEYIDKCLHNAYLLMIDENINRHNNQNMTEAVYKVGFKGIGDIQELK